MKTKTNKTASGLQPRFFDSEDDAIRLMRDRNRSERDAKRPAWWCVVDGPEDNFAVVDLETAIDLGGGYRWAI